ncbi:MAG: hypothetical protein ACRDAX_02005 [Propionibacteriaceae bacterium]
MQIKFWRKGNEAATATTQIASSVGFYAGISAALGLCGGLVWRYIVKVPVYQLYVNGKAVISDTDLVGIFSMDAWYSIIGIFCGGILGYIAWLRFRELGWKLVLLATAGALLAAFSCWMVSHAFAPASFADRLASARVGDIILVDFRLHTPVPVFLWVAAAMAVLLILATVTPDPDAKRLSSNHGDNASS